MKRTTVSAVRLTRLYANDAILSLRYANILTRYAVATLGVFYDRNAGCITTVMQSYAGCMRSYTIVMQPACSLHDDRKIRPERTCSLSAYFTIVFFSIFSTLTSVDTLLQAVSQLTVQQICSPAADGGMLEYADPQYVNLQQ